MNALLSIPGDNGVLTLNLYYRSFPLHLNLNNWIPPPPPKKKKQMIHASHASGINKFMNTKLKLLNSNTGVYNSVMTDM
jgi:hypothetical protein